MQLDDYKCLCRQWFTGMKLIDSIAIA